MIIKYLWEQYINLRQINRNLIKDIPPELASYNISLSDFILGQSYSFDKMAFQMLALSIKMGVDCLCIMCDILPFIWDNVDHIFPFININDQFQRAMGYILIEAFILKAFYVPLSSYQTFIIQKKYGFTNKTLDLFIYDLFVEAILMIIIFPPILFGYLRIVQYGGDHFYLFLQVIYTFISFLGSSIHIIIGIVYFNRIYRYNINLFNYQIFALVVTILLGWIHPNLIAPLFNEFKQLSNQNLSSHLNYLAEKVNFPLKKILWMNQSVRSAHSNAYFYGFGKTKVIVLYDTLMLKLNHKQITSVVCHQLGHWTYNHSIQKLFVYLIEVLSLFYIFSFFLQNQSVFLSFGFKQKSTFIGTALFFHLFQPLASIFDTVLLILTRKFQFQADIFACQNGYGQQLKNSLIKLFKESTATVKPDSLYAWLKHSHPTVHQRVIKIQQYQNKRNKKQEQWQLKQK